jgi:large conductance mechanosensitive channel
MLKEFKDFIGGGNVMDLAVAVIVGGAMQKIIQAVVDELIVPLIGLLPGAGDLAARYLVLKSGATPIPDGAPLAKARETGAVVLGYGQVLSTAITVLITAFAVFLIVRAINNMKRKDELEAETAAVTEVGLLTEIRDLLNRK